MTFIVPIVPNDVTALPFTPARRSASGAQGERSSHSPTTMPATPARRAERGLRGHRPATWPATLRMISRIARPIAAALVATPPKQP